MEIPVKTLKSGFSLPAYGLGTWGMGGKGAADRSQDGKWLSAIAMALDHGITHIDTAELYGNGHAEELIGRAIAGRDRSKLFITSKVLAGMHNGYESVMRAAHASLERLGTDYIDLYLLHRYPMHDLEDIIRAINELLEDGLIKHVGVSNMTIPRMRKVQSLTDHPIVCNQVEYSLLSREAEHYGIIEYCQQHDMMITAWGPLGTGNFAEVELLQELAAKYGKTPNQIALNWLISQPNVVAIPKTSSAEHLEENLGALSWELSAEDMRRLTKDFPGQQTVSTRVPLDYPGEIPA